MRIPVLLVFAMTVAFGAGAGCRSSTKVDGKARARAAAAKDELARALITSLKSAIANRGVAAAVRVCASKAQVIAERIGAEHNVAIGRTSFGLRNPGNVAPEWARPHVEARAAEPVYVDLGDQRLGALFPIRLAKLCERCHGDPTGFGPGLRETLARSFPADRATGFAEGDLRGWFWVETR